MSKEIRGRTGIHIEDLKLGKKATLKLKKFEGQRVYFRKYGKGGLWERTTRNDARILKLHKVLKLRKDIQFHKWSAPQIARKVGCPVNRVYHVLSKYKRKKG